MSPGPLHWIHSHILTDEETRLAQGHVGSGRTILTIKTMILTITFCCLFQCSHYGHQKLFLT